MILVTPALTSLKLSYLAHWLVDDRTTAPYSKEIPEHRKFLYRQFISGITSSSKLRPLDKASNRS